MLCIYIIVTNGLAYYSHALFCAHLSSDLLYTARVQMCQNDTILF